MTPVATSETAPQAKSRGGNDRAAMIEADNLTKFYGDFAACRDVTFTINQGEVAAFLGPNGAGKSTTMKLLTGYLAPSAGTARMKNTGSGGGGTAAGGTQAASAINATVELTPTARDLR